MTLGNLGRLARSSHFEARKYLCISVLSLHLEFASGSDFPNGKRRKSTIPNANKLKKIPLCIPMRLFPFVAYHTNMSPFGKIWHMIWHTCANVCQKIRRFCSKVTNGGGSDDFPTSFGKSSSVTYYHFIECYLSPHLFDEGYQRLVFH